MKTRTNRREEITTPTDAQLASGAFELVEITEKNKGRMIRLGKAYRRKRMLEALAAKGVFSADQYKALAHYRHHADVADKSPLSDSLGRQRGGSGNPPSIEILNAVRITSDCERAAGSLADILRAVIVYDTPLATWAMQRHGSVERVRTKRGSRVSVIEPTQTALRFAKLDLRMVALRIEAMQNSY